MNKPSGKFFVTFFITVCVAYITWHYGQYIPCLLGIFTGILRVIWFWISGEGDRFARHEVNLPKVKRSIPEQQTLEVEYQGYIRESQKNEFWRKPAGMLGLIMAIMLLLYLDKNLIFYTFLAAMLTTWLWFQWWLSYKIH